MEQPSGGPVAWEIERGLTCVQSAHYADAVAHFSIARERIPETQARVLVALDGFVESHTRYWEAQQALHEASHRFVVASTDQEARFADLQEALAGNVDRPDAAAVESNAAGRVEAVDWQEEAPQKPQPGAHNVQRAGTSQMLSIRCFGRFEVRRDNATVVLCRNKKGQAILRYLAAQPRHHETVDALIDALWPDDSAEIARHKLHVAASALRGALKGEFADPKGAGYLVFKNGGYELDPDTVQVDADDFEAQFRAGQLAGGSAAVPHYESACRLYAGPFLTEDLYADWSFMRRERLAQVHVAMCGALAAYAFDTADYGAAARWATAMLEHDRCNEAACRQLMRAYAAEGRRGEALRQYQHCEQVLQSELGVAPMTETTDLFYALLRGEPPPPTT